MLQSLHTVTITALLLIGGSIRMFAAPLAGRAVTIETVELPLGSPTAVGTHTVTYTSGQPRGHPGVAVFGGRVASADRPATTVTEYDYSFASFATKVITRTVQDP